jgi:predicted DNA-binding transcriptional regulator YafY
VNRTDRLYAMTEELRRVGPRGTTSTRLARLFEVTPRTVKRDVSALQQAGVPVVAQPGPGGGYVLAGATLPPVALTPAQAVALALAVDALPPGSPFGVDARTARDKVLDALPAADRARVADLAARVWTRPDERAPAAGDRPAGGDGAPPPAVLRAVEEGLARHRVLALRYVDGRGTASERRVEPMLLARTRGTWYLAAWCRTRDGVRWFRLDRIRRADVTPETHTPRAIADVGAPPDDARPVGRLADVD